MNYYATFKCRHYSVFKKMLKSFLTPKNRHQKLLIIGPQLFLCTGLAAQTAQKQKSRTTKSPLIQDWAFRLGLHAKPAGIPSLC